VPHTDPEILSLWALGESAGSPAEQEHLAGCADCSLELAQLRELVAVAREDGPVRLERPPAGLWDQIAAAAGVEEPAPAEGPQPPEPMPHREPRAAGPRRRMRGRLAIAAAAGIVIGAGTAVGIAELVSAPPPAASAIARIPLRPLAQFPQWRGASGTAVMRLTSATRVLDVTLSAPQKPGFYEVWLLGRDGVSMISLGDLSTGHSGSFTVPPGTDLQFYSRVDVSLQPFDGSTVHVKASVVRGSLPTAVTGAG